jgi:ABC-type multidrug transport system ATPase subunit
MRSARACKAECKIRGSTFLGSKESQPSMIHVENLVKTFGEVKAVDGISFDISPGEIFAFLGPNGAGKTTTIQMLTTLQRPTSGSIRLPNHCRRAADSGSCFRIRVSTSS